MVRQPVHVLAQNLGRIVAQHLRASAIDEHAEPVKINTENALTRGLQQQPELIGPGERMRTALG